MGRCSCSEVLVASCSCGFQASDCIEISGSGAAGNPFIIEPILDPSADNELECGANGLLVEGPRGLLGYAEVVTSQSSITDGTDITGLQTTVTVGANRRIKITVFTVGMQATTGAETDTWRITIREGGSQLTARLIFGFVASGYISWGGTTQRILTPSAGAHTYKVTITRVTGSTGSLTHVANGATETAFIAVEDIGPA